MTALTATAAATPLPTRPEPPVRSITIMGRELRIKSDEDADRLRELAAHVDEIIASVAQGKTQPPDQHLLLVTALRLADEVFRLREEKQELTSILKRSTRAILGRIRGATDGEPLTLTAE